MASNELLFSVVKDEIYHIPLYTHPMRELTDEEIDEVWVETCSDFKLIENGKSKGIINIYDVSRAILQKASEK
jgi:hypothetical protein